MITTTRSESRTVRVSWTILASFMLLGFAGPLIPTAAGPPPTHVLADGNSQIDIDINAQATVYNWFVDGIDHLTELSNWYRITGGTDETSVDGLNMNILSAVATNTNGDPRDDTLAVLYEDLSQSFQMTIVYSVAGGFGGSGFGQLDEDITIFNLSYTNDLSIRVFEYVDLDLYESPGDDLLELTGPNGLHQYDPLTDYIGSFEVDRYELETYPNTLIKFSDGLPSNLNDVWPAGAGPIGPDNVTWALQWNFIGPPPGSPPGFRYRIPARQMAHIHKEGFLQMQFIPEPASWTLLLFSGMALIVVRWRHRTTSQ